MEQRVYITGASGGGITTLGAHLAAVLGVCHIDIDNAFWLPTDPPYTTKRSLPERLEMIRAAQGQGGWVLSGAFDSWGEPAIEAVDLILFVVTPTPVRLARLRAREAARFGDRIAPGGDMHAIHDGFINWAARYDDPEFSGRNLARHEEWLECLPQPVLRLDGTDPTKAQVAQVLTRLGVAAH